MALAGFDVLGQGQVASAGGDMYLVPASTEAAIKYISLLNTAGGTVNVSIYINDNSGTANKQWKQVQLTGQYDGWEWDGSLLLGTGDRVWIKADVNNQVNYVISGTTNV